MSATPVKQFRVGFFASAFLLFAGVLAGVGAPRSPHDRSRRVEFSRDIAPIVFHSCTPCHHAGEAGPFPLATYGDVKSHARQIADITRKRLMPPWLPAAEGPRFEEDSHLSDQQIALFQKWVADGLLEGNSAELPPAPKFDSG